MNSTSGKNTTMGASTSGSLGVAIVLSLANIISIFFGSWGNLLVVIVVVCNRGLHSSTNFFIASLASADLIVTSICMPVFFVYNAITWPVWHFGGIVCRIISYLVHTSVMASALSLLAISYDRFLSIFFPMKRIVTPSRAKGVVAFIWCVSPFLLVPSLLHHDVVKTTYNSQDALMCVETWDTEEQLHTYQLYRIGCYYLFVLQISVLYFVIGCKLYRREPPGVQTSQGKAKLNQDKKKILQMLFSVVLLFAFSWLPYIINKMLNIFPPSKDFKSPDLFVFVGNFLGLLNSVANPVVYAVLNKNFRIAFRHAIRCHFRYERDERRRQSIISMRNTTQSRDRKRTLSNSSRFTGIMDGKRKNSVFSTASIEWATLPGTEEPQVRCLSFTKSDDDTLSRSNSHRRSCSKPFHSSQRRVSFGPEISNGEVSLELQMETTHLKYNKISHRGSTSTGTKPRSSTLSSLGPIKELNSNLFDSDDVKVNQGFDFNN